MKFQATASLFCVAASILHSCAVQTAAAFAPAPQFTSRRGVTSDLCAIIGKIEPPLADRFEPPETSSVALQAVGVGTVSELEEVAALGDDEEESSGLLSPVLTTALLIAGNEIGASCLALPQVAQGPGMLPATGLFLSIYGFHLLSGLVVAEIAIKQHEASGDEVPSSFRAFSEANLEDNPLAINSIATISIFSNLCVLAFNIAKAGTIGSNIFESVDASVVAICFTTVLATLVGTQTRERLSAVGSVVFLLLVSSFAVLLVPGLSHISDPIGTFTATTGDNNADDLVGGLLKMAPIAFQAAFYQNLVPTATKILKYDRRNVMTAIGLGSLLPTLLFIAWTFSVLGGGVSLEGTDGIPLRAFSCTALCGSALGCTVAISEEIDAVLESTTTSFPTSPKTDNDQIVVSSSDTAPNTKFSWPAVLIAASLPLGAGLWSSAGNGDVAASFLFFAGAFCTPLLCGPVPVGMAFLQRQKWPSSPNMVPAAGLGLVGVGSLAFVGQEFLEKFGPSLMMPQ